MHIQIPHKFTQTEAVARVKRALVEARTKIGDQATIEKEEWVGNTLNFAFTAQGTHIEGTLEVNEHDFEADAKLPFMLRMFEGRIEKAIKEQVATLLGQK